MLFIILYHGHLWIQEEQTGGSPDFQILHTLVQAWQPDVGCWSSGCLYHRPNSEFWEGGGITWTSWHPGHISSSVGEFRAASTAHQHVNKYLSKESCQLAQPSEGPPPQILGNAADLAANMRVLWPTSFSLEGFLTWLCSLEATYCSACYCLTKLNGFFSFSFFPQVFGLVFYLGHNPFCLSDFAFPSHLLQTRLLGFREIADSHGQMLRFSFVIEPVKGEFSFRHCGGRALLALTGAGGVVVGQGCPLAEGMGWNWGV